MLKIAPVRQCRPAVAVHPSLYTPLDYDSQGPGRRLSVLGRGRAAQGEPPVGGAHRGPGCTPPSPIGLPTAAGVFRRCLETLVPAAKPPKGSWLNRLRRSLAPANSRPSPLFSPGCFELFEIPYNRQTDPLGPASVPAQASANHGHPCFARGVPDPAAIAFPWPTSHGAPDDPLSSPAFDYPLVSSSQLAPRDALGRESPRANLVATGGGAAPAPRARSLWMPRNKRHARFSPIATVDGPELKRHP